MSTRIVLAVVIAVGALQPRVLVREVSSSADVPWLERLCTDLDFAEQEYAARGRNTAGVKGVRSAAYARLGELGTPESLGAIARIESAHRGQSVLPRVVVPGGWRYHPAPHMSDSRWRIDRTARLSDGRDAAAFIFDFYGSPSLFVATGTGERWGRPHLVQSRVQRFVTVTLREVRQGRLRAEFTTASPAGMKLTQAPPVPDAIEFNLSDIELDSDGDGWTDVEEDWLGMSWRSADSDRDGLPDGSDATPTLESTRGQTDPAGAVLLRRALFAMFGLTSAPHALFVRINHPGFTWTTFPDPSSTGRRGAVSRVTWKIRNRSDAQATVEITDYESPLAASGNEVTLRRIGGDW